MQLAHYCYTHNKSKLYQNNKAENFLGWETQRQKVIIMKKTYFLFMDGVQLYQGYRAPTKRGFTFYYSVLHEFLVLNCLTWEK